MTKLDDPGVGFRITETMNRFLFSILFVACRRSRVISGWQADLATNKQRNDHRELARDAE
jgi:hypothetical protein